ncbi:hypothetical protein GW17_00043948 [Ensete ventricosum]|nr:hypothetical protein GW17_00043948 [Ensete ventricosum]
MCASLPAVFSVRSWSSAGWMVPQGSTREVCCWNGGARVGRKYSSSGRSLTPARRPGRVGSRRDPSDGQVSFVVYFLPIPLPRRGAGAYIVGVVDHPYLTTWLPLWLTMPSYTSTTPAVLAVRDASTGKGISLTCVRSAVRPLGIRPYLCQVGRTTTGTPIPASDQLPASADSIEHEPGKWSGTGADPTEQELGNLNVARADPTEQEFGNWDGTRADLTEYGLGNSNVARADPTEQELGNWDGTRADLTEHGLGNWNGTRADLTEQELGNLNVASADPTEQELGNWDGTRADLTEYGLGNWNGTRANLTEQELGNLNLGFCQG